MYPAESRAVLFADLVGSTAAYERLGDRAAKNAVDQRITGLKRAVHQLRGAVIKTLGDAILATFHDANAAAAAAVRMLLDVADDVANGREGFNVRVGFHHGAVILEADDVFGDAVNVAARLTDAARGGQILTSAPTVALLSALLRSRARAFDRARLKGKVEVVDIYELLWEREEDVTRIAGTSDSNGRAIDQARQNLLELTLGARQWRFASTRMPLAIGRDEACDVPLRHALASRRHAQFEYQRGKFLLSDHSTNGSYITSAAGREVFLRRESMPLADRGFISLGCPLSEQTEEVLRFRVE